ncbi:MAG: OmpA family protein [Ferruginibacter sp.]
MYITRLLTMLIFLIGSTAIFSNAADHNIVTNYFSTSYSLQQPFSKPHTDTLPKSNDVIVIIPFEYKQSSLNFTSTFRLMDSVADVLSKNDSVTLTINGYSYLDEGSNYICYWLSYNRALAVKTYVLGRGIDSSRVIKMEAKSKKRSVIRRVKNEPVDFNCTAEIVLNYPIPLPPVAIKDKDEDGIADDKDSCVNDYGEAALNGCPNKDAIIVPFEPGFSSLFSTTYSVMDSVISILRKDPTISLAIEGHAYQGEGVETLCDKLAKERADIVRRYLLTRRIPPARITRIKDFGNTRPLNAGRNPWEQARNSRAELFLLHN